MTNKKIVLAGATGQLGSLIAAELLKDPHITLEVLSRQHSEQTDVLARQGATIHVTDYTDLHPIKSAFEGTFSVISALQGDESVIVDAQLRLYQQVIEAGCQCFIPSDYSFNLFALEKGENWLSDIRRTFAQQATALNAPTQLVHVNNGCFLDTRVLFGFLGAVDLKSRTANYWGDGQFPLDFTTFADTAAYTAQMATDERDMPNKFYVVGDRCNFHELVASLERETGQAFKVIHNGSMDELDQTIARRIQKSPNNLFSFIPLMYYRAMLNGKGSLPTTHNHLFPEIQPTGVAAYIRHIVRPLVASPATASSQ
ncbi:NmrA family NAD(P)-binding protein [Tunicatimonas pelagia]|uniref:NmrA family NAD(P)-binding protein n=1 Tax=Tunicatimonas pelagia TaxID=931531 RepID=UPI00266500A4|nr:NmrA family NAD(P)-binding protein [Tunicatimonas pelagia]WKN45443.1 NmrA family NAD(P)-binding protein [Tunicatimonas pelagia]